MICAWLSPSSLSHSITWRARSVTRQWTSSAVMGPKSSPRQATPTPPRQPAPPIVPTNTPSTTVLTSHIISDLTNVASAARVASTEARARFSGLEGSSPRSRPRSTRRPRSSRPPPSTVASTQAIAPRAMNRWKASFSLSAMVSQA